MVKMILGWGDDPMKVYLGIALLIVVSVILLHRKIFKL